MYVRKASGMPHAWLRSRWVDVVRERNVVEVHAGANLMWFGINEDGEDGNGRIQVLF
jgi:hypothetical protein